MYVYIYTYQSKDKQDTQDPLESIRRIQEQRAVVRGVGRDEVVGLFHEHAVRRQLRHLR